MTSFELLAQLRQRDVALWADGDQLCYDAPDGALTPDVLAQLAAHKADILMLLRTARQAVHDLPVSLQPAPRDRPLPLSFAQQRLWFLDQLAPGAAPYIVPAPMRLTGRLRVAVLARSLNAIMRRHEAVRTTFAMHAGQAVQVIAPPAPLPLVVVDLQALPADEREAYARRLAAEEARLPFDLSRGPLLRATLLRLNPLDHVVLLAMHHIVSDGWSLGVLVRELAEIYAALLRGRMAALPELPIQYADYAVWQRERLQGAVLERELEYWRRQLAGLTTLDLPTDRPRPPIQRYRGAGEDFTLAPALSSRLKELSQRAGATLFMTLLAAFQALLARYSAQDDIVVATRIAGRTRVETEGLIGFFINALVLRTDLSGDPGFEAVLERAREVTLGGYAHQEVPFERLVEELQPVRDLSRNPLFQVMVVLQNVPVPTVELPELTLRSMPVLTQTATFDLNLSLNEYAGGLNGTFEYNTDLFDAATISRMIGHFQSLLEGCAADPRRRLADLPLLSDAERNQLLVEWNATAADFPADASLAQLFAAQTTRTPDAVALIFEQRPPTTTRSQGSGIRGQEAAAQPSSHTLHAPTNDPSPLHPFTPSPLHPFTSQQLTYAELNYQATHLAHQLCALGVGSEVAVALYLPRSPRALLALLAILKSGGVFVPLDVAAPPTHLAAVLDASEPAVLLTEQPLRQWLPPTRARVLTFEQLATQDVSAAAELPPSAPEQLIAILHTSGSTGQPKAVGLSQRLLLKRLAWMWQSYPFAPGEVACQRSALTFSVALAELLGPLLQGVPVVLLPDALVLDPPRLLATLAAHYVSRIVVVPALLRVLLDTPLDLARTLPRLRLWSALGEPLEGALCRRFYARLPNALLLNQYGASEVLDVACYDTRQLPIDAVGVPLGRAIANTQLYVLDRHMQVVPLGVVGELYVGGAALARGYLNHPDLTAERFVPNPFWGMGDGGWGMGAEFSIPHPPSPIPRLYRTGDLARYRADGVLEGLGRRDEQVKLRGVRVELGGVAAVLSQHPAVREAVVLAREEAAGEQRLVAYLVTSNELQVTSREDSLLVTRHSSLVTELRDFLRERLPAAMVPSAFVIMPSLPLTPNGKLDRRALPAPDNERSFSNRPYIAPRDNLELQLAQIWEAVLHIRSIGASDNFFELGGTSLLAVRVLDLIDKRIGQSLSMTTFLVEPTIEHLAAVLRQREWPRVMQLVDDLPQITSPLVEIKPTGTRRPFFFVAPLGGVLPSNILSGFLDLAPHFDPQQPYYGLQLPGLADHMLPGLDLRRPPDIAQLGSLVAQITPDRRIVEAAAAECIRAMRTVQPEGPYLLGGFCTGGIITFEMAHQLRQQGEQVALTTLVDTDSSILGLLSAEPSVNGTGEAPPELIARALNIAEDPDLAQLAWFIARDLGGNRLAKSLEQIHSDLLELSWDDRWRYGVEQLKLAGAVAQDTEPQEIRRMFLIYQINRLSLNYILASYTPPTYPGKITFFRAEQVYGAVPDPTMGWSRFSAQPAEIYITPGDHGTVFHEPHVRVLAKQMQACLDAAEGRT